MRSVCRNIPAAVIVSGICAVSLAAPIRKTVWFYLAPAGLIAALIPQLWPGVLPDFWLTMVLACGAAALTVVQAKRRQVLWWCQWASRQLAYVYYTEAIVFFRR